MNDGLADYGRVVEMWVHAANASVMDAGSKADAWINSTLPVVLQIGRYMLMLRRNATSAIDLTSAMHGMVWGPAEHDTCGAPDYHLNVQAWCWRGELELGRWLSANGREMDLARELLDDAREFRSQLIRAVQATTTQLPDGGVFLSAVLCDPKVPRPYPPTCAELRTPYVNLTQETPATRSTQWYHAQSIPAYEHHHCHHRCCCCCFCFRRPCHHHRPLRWRCPPPPPLPPQSPPS
jgi:hypothetical protein